MRCRVNNAAVLAVGVEPTRAEAQRLAMPSRLPVPPRQHLFRQRTLTPQRAETRRHRNRSGPRGQYTKRGRFVRHRNRAVTCRKLSLTGSVATDLAGQDAGPVSVGAKEESRTGQEAPPAFGRSELATRNRKPSQRNTQCAPPAPSAPVPLLLSCVSPTPYTLYPTPFHPPLPTDVILLSLLPLLPLLLSVNQRVSVPSVATNSLANTTRLAVGFPSSNTRPGVVPGTPPSPPSCSAVT